MAYAFVAVSAVVPSLLLIWYFHSRDIYPEPAKVVWTTFGLSVLTVIPVLVVALPVAMLFADPIENAYVGGLATAFLAAAIPEEIFKFLVVYFYAMRHEEFDEPMDGIVYGVVGSLGFATLENVLYTVQGGLTVAIARAVTAVPCHAFLGAIMGYFIGQARFNEGKKRWVMLTSALFWPILLHGLYDFPLMTMKRLRAGSTGVEALSLGLLGATLAVLIVEAVWAFRVTRRLRREQKELDRATQAEATLQAAPKGAAPAAPAAAAVAASPAAPAAPAGAAAAAPSDPWAVQKTPPLAPVFMGLGGLLSSAGGLVVLGVAFAFLAGGVDSGDVFNVALGTLIIGGLPLVVGIVLFRSGMRRLPRVRRARPGEAEAAAAPKPAATGR
jgi:RsiW-degrading membrane proteinase PrsW (M82 family)